ncbi:E3 ubiquitin protein ligase RIE1-like [Bidens hawaiensis]
MEYVKRNDMSERRVPTDPNASVPGMSSGYSTNSDGGDLPAVPPTRWDLLNTGVSCLWWVLGFILMMCYNSSATPCLFWLTVAYLAMDVFFLVLATVVFCSIE